MISGQEGEPGGGHPLPSHTPPTQILRSNSHHWSSVGHHEMNEFFSPEKVEIDTRYRPNNSAYHQVLFVEKRGKKSIIVTPITIMFSLVITYSNTEHNCLG